MADKRKIAFVIEVMGGGVFVHINYQSVVATPEMKVTA